MPANRDRIIGTALGSTLHLRSQAHALVAASPVFADCFFVYEWVNPFLVDNRHADNRTCGLLQLFTFTVKDNGGLSSLVAAFTVPRGRKEQTRSLGPGARALVLTKNVLGWKPTEKDMAHAVIPSWNEALWRLYRTGPWLHLVLFEHPPPKPPVGAVVPPRDPTNHDGFARDPAVWAWALRRARWRCEACGCPAPFLTAGGEPYLEVHHLRRLADGGSDTVDNVAALCPACHREVHLGEEAEALRLRLVDLRGAD